jgi:hypothetical protein
MPDDDNNLRNDNEVEVIAGRLHVFGGCVVCVISCFVKFTTQARFLYQVAREKVVKVPPPLEEEATVHTSSVQATVPPPMAEQATVPNLPTSSVQATVPVPRSSEHATVPNLQTSSVQATVPVPQSSEQVPKRVDEVKEFDI